ncbi:sulfurtransferase [Sphingomonas sp. So64.6b]|uniref:chromate resistance protein ChrB domain-containing protein n=1 Tax=Sphingomonas sp. So64.6b TaxID=2997354 RepID=UPI0016018178|nr:chromate resistance protein ChrB domain-containing protein [Sphingomonas sp. So64.6b]QNA84229.1 sulfurtransferase [Sphingomonas sp. So64.6b]
MPAINSITIDKLARLIGTARSPAIIDIRDDAHWAIDPYYIPGAQRRSAAAPAAWAGDFAARTAVIVCEDGGASNHGVAAWLLQAGVPAEPLEGGFDGWKAAGLPTIADAAVPPRDATGRTLWVTRARPKVDRFACPWLIRRFIDPAALFLFGSAPEVPGVAQNMGATPFDVEGEGAEWNHRGERCTFDVMVEEFGLAGHEPLTRLATIVRGADTGHADLAPEAAELLAISPGLSRIYGDDLEQLDAGLQVYGALYRWCRDAIGETHSWTSHVPTKVRERV